MTLERHESPTQFSHGLITFLRSLLTPNLWDYVIWNRGKVSPKKKEETVENRKKIMQTEEWLLQVPKDFQERYRNLEVFRITRKQMQWKFFMYLEIGYPVRLSEKSDFFFFFYQELNRLKVLNFVSHQGNANKGRGTKLEIMEYPRWRKRVAAVTPASALAPTVTSEKSQCSTGPCTQKMRTTSQSIHIQQIQQTPADSCSQILCGNER